MKALSIWQPWASLIAIGAKHVETRHWGTPYRGPLLIHASKRWTGAEREAAQDAFDILPTVFREKIPAEPPLGAVVAVAELYGCVQMSENLIGCTTNLELQLGGWEVGRFAWQLVNVRPLPTPFAARGAQGLFDLPVTLRELGL